MSAPSARRPRVAVLYDVGSASPVELVQGVGAVADIVWVLAASEHAALMAPLVSGLGPSTRWAGAAATARALLADGPVDHVVSCSERALVDASRLAAALGCAGFHDKQTAVRLTNKHAQRVALAAEGVGSARHALVPSLGHLYHALAVVGLPAVLKPVHGEGSRDTHLVRTPAEAAGLVQALFAADRGRVLQLEELLESDDRARLGDYVSVESLSRNGHVAHLAVTGKFPLVPPFREPGQFWPSGLDQPAMAGVHALTTDALRALGVRDGLTHTEIKLTRAGPRIIEVNGRIGGFVNELSLRSRGVNLLSLATDVAHGRTHGLEGWTEPAGRIVFQYSNLPPARTDWLERVHGALAVRRRSQVDAYRVLLRPPSPVLPGVATQELDLICGRADDPEQMLAEAMACTQLLEFVFRGTFGQMTTVRGDELPAAAVLRRACSH